MKAKVQGALICGASLLILSVFCLGAKAQASSDQIEEVVVTASKTGAQQSQRVPIALSVFSADQLGENVANNVKDLAAETPNLIVGQILTSAEFYIRGIGSNNTAPGSDPDVTEQIDGVYIARPSAQLQDFLDVQRVEILRGPQGTLYGRNAIGGTINIISRTPSDEFTAEEVLNVGNYSLVQEQAYLSGPLVPGKLQASLAVNYLNHDAYFKNIVPGAKAVGTGNRGGAHLQLRFEATSKLEAITRADWSRADEDNESYSEIIAPTAFPSLANSIVGNYSKVALNSPQHAFSSIGGVSEELNYAAFEWLNIKSITAYRFDVTKLTNDNDATEQLLQFSRQQEHERAYSQEIDFQINTQRFHGVAGYFYFHDNDGQFNTIAVPPSIIMPAVRSAYITARPLVKSTSNAVFAQGTYDILPDVSVTLGLRYTDDEKAMTQYATRTSLNPATLGAPLPGSPYAFGVSGRYHGLTPKIGVSWQVTDDDLVYISATRGYKSGGFNFSALSASSASFQPETVWSYEAGAKTEWLDHRLRMNLAGFVYKYRNLQVQQLVAPGTLSIGNAATATGKGIELEFVAKPTSSLELSGNLSFLDATYDSYLNAAVPTALIPFVSGPNCAGIPPTCTINASGKYLDGAPKYSAELGADYRTSLGSEFALVLHGDVAWRDTTYFDPSNVAVMSQGAYAIVNAHITLIPSSTHWSVELWGKNIADKRYLVTTAASGVTPDGFAGDPRTYGIRLVASW